MVKSTAIDPSVVDADGVYRKRARARLHDASARPSPRSRAGARRVKAGDVLVLICRGPMGTGMEETYQVTAALKHLPFGKHVAVLTDARFSGVSTGACIGHIGPEALAGGPIGKLRDGDLIRIAIDRKRLEGAWISSARARVRARGGRARARRPATPARPRAPHPALPATRGYGPRCRRPAAAPGAAASTTSMRSPRCSRAGRR